MDSPDTQNPEQSKDAADGSADSADSTVYYQKGEEFANQNQYSTALTYFDRAIALQPNDCATWVFRAVVLIHLQRYEEALISCDRALALQPLDPEAWLFRGVALQRLGRYTEAYSDYQRALDPGESKNCAEWQGTGWTKWQQWFKQAWKVFGLSHFPS